MRWLLKHWWWGRTVFILVAIAAGYLLIPISEGRIGRANCERIQLGMTLEDVELLLGDKYMPIPGSLRKPDFLVWFDDDGNRIAVGFNWQHNVIEKKFCPTERSFYERIRGRIERRIRALERRDYEENPFR